MWCLAWYLPLIIGDHIPLGYTHWETFLLFLIITDYVFAPVCCHNDIAYIKKLIKEHHEMVRLIYSDSSFIPKLHALYCSCTWMVIEVCLDWCIYVRVLEMCYFTGTDALFINNNYQEYIFRCGPLSRIWYMRFEAKHGFFKNISHCVKCFKNIGKTLAFHHHQRLMCFHLSSSCNAIPQNILIIPKSEYYDEIINES